MTVIVFIAGILLGIVISMVIVREYHVGTLRIDQSDTEDGPFIFLELDKGLSTIGSHKYVLLKINLKSYISHE